MMDRTSIFMNACLSITNQNISYCIRFGSVIHDIHMNTRIPLVTWILNKDVLQDPCILYQLAKLWELLN